LQSDLFKPTRFVVDMIGPLVDISKIQRFRGLDCRFDTEYTIADKLNNQSRGTFDGPPRKEAGWTSKDVLDLVVTQLKQPSGLHLVEGELLRALSNAADAGFEVTFTSTVSSKEVFDAAKKAVELYLAAFPELRATASKTLVTFQPLNTTFKKSDDPTMSNSLWREFLLLDNGAHFTVVLNDSTADDLALDRELYGEWITGVLHAPDLASQILRIVEERKRAKDAHNFLSGQEKLIKSKLNAIGDFGIWNEEIRSKIVSKWRRALDLRESVTKESQPICVFLGGPPGSGKSFFVKQCLKSFSPSPLSLETISLSGVSRTQYEESIDKHVERAFQIGVSATEPHVAFLDEVDTVNGTETAFRYLMDPMTGAITDAEGKKINQTKTSPSFWFFAGSLSNSRNGFVEELKKYDEKVRDFFDRIQVFIELPGVSEPSEAVFQAIISIMELRPKIRKFEKSALLAFGANKWRSARELKTVCQMVALDLEENDTILKLENLQLSSDISGFKAIVEQSSNGFRSDEFVLYED
jgi:hypothetical protein